MKSLSRVLVLTVVCVVTTDAVLLGQPAAPATGRLLRENPGLRTAQTDGRLRAIYGRPMATDDNPATSTDAFVESFLARHKDAFGVAGVDLVQRDKMNTGSGKFTVYTFEQRIENLPVHGSLLRVAVLGGATEKIPYVGIMLVPHPEEPLPRDVIGGDEAVAGVRAAPAYGNLTTFSAPEKVIYEDETQTLHRTWRFSGSGGMESYLFLVDTSTSEIVAAMDTVLHGTVAGNVDGFATGCTAPDDPDCANCCPAFNPTNPDSCPRKEDLSGVKVSCTGQADAYADEYGDFNFGDVGGDPVTVQSVLQSQWVTVFNNSGDELSASGAGNPPQTLNLIFNYTDACSQWPLEYDTAQVNAFVGVQRTHKWIADLQPGYPGLDKNVNAYVNLPTNCTLGPACQAFYDTETEDLEFTASGCGCNNAAYSTNVSHEYGHFIVDQRIPTFPGWQENLEFTSFHEGAADTISALVWDTELKGLDLVSGYPLRNLDVPNVKLGQCLTGSVPWFMDCAALCGLPECKGLAMAGAFWDLRKEMLKCSGGDDDGDPCNPDADCPGGVCRFDNVCEGGANNGLSCDRHAECASPGICSDDGDLEQLFTDFLTITHGRLDELIFVQVLIADDDDGDLSSTPPTPHYDIIHDSFVTGHGWSGLCQAPAGDSLLVKWNVGEGPVTAPPGSYHVEYAFQYGACLPSIGLIATEDDQQHSVRYWYLGRTVNGQPADLGTVYANWDGPPHDIEVWVGTALGGAPCKELPYLQVLPQSPVHYSSLRLDLTGSVGTAMVDDADNGAGGLISGTIAEYAIEVHAAGIGVGASQPGDLTVYGGITNDSRIGRVGAGSTLAVEGFYNGDFSIEQDLNGTIHVLADHDEEDLWVVGTGVSDGDVLVDGDVASGIWFSPGGMDGDILANGAITGTVYVHGAFNGNICGTNLDPDEALPPNIQLTMGPSALVCGSRPSLTPTSWRSVATHGSVGEVALDIPADGSYSEARGAGISKIVVSFEEAIDPDSASPANVSLEGCDLNGDPMDLGSTAIGVTTASEDTQVVVTFDPKLPGSDVSAHDPARYRIALDGLQTARHVPVTPDDRILTAVLGDAFGLPFGTGDRKVTAADNGLLRSLAYGDGVDPINPADPIHVRSDVVTDGKIDASDADLVQSLATEGLDGTGIPCP